MVDLSEIRKKTVSANEYINGLEQPFREKFLARKRTYQLHTETVKQLKTLKGLYVVVAFSAAWCKDCAANIPVLALLSEETGLEVRVFGGLRKDPLSHLHKWRIPPSPPETELFNVDKIPLVLIFDIAGNETGRIVETPKRQPTLEQEILEIIISGQRLPSLKERGHG
jgi:thiol-disulfide isomerase/thioredoxin